MSLINSENFFLIWMGFCFSVFLLLIPFNIVMHFLMPKAVLDKYFKPPYFRPMEVEMFTGIPYAPMRTAMLMWVLAFPRFGKKRRLAEAYLLVPIWYRLLSKLFFMLLFFIFAGMLGGAIGFYVYLKLAGHL